MREHRRCVAFDIDDTLYLERDYVRSGFAAVSQWIQRHLGISGFLEAAWLQFEAGRRGHIFEAVLRSRGFAYDAALIQQMVEIYRNHRPDIRLEPDASRFFNEQHSPAVRFAVVTDGPLASQRRKAEALRLHEWAAPIILTASRGPRFHKPSAEAFAEVQRTLALEGRACCYVADNPSKDFAGPKSLGWFTVRVRRPAGLHAALPSDQHVDVEIEDLDPLARLVFDSFPGTAQ